MEMDKEEKDERIELVRNEVEKHVRYHLLALDTRENVESKRGFGGLQY